MTASLPRIDLGTVGLDTPDEAAAVATALELGYRRVNTTRTYRNKAVAGNALAATDIPREDVTLATRVWTDSLVPADMRRTTRENLEKLGIDFADLLYIHRPIDTCDPEATLATFDEFVDDGLARGVGVSNFAAAELDEALDLLDTSLVAHQTEYHLLFQRSELLDHAEERGYDVVAYSPFSGGRVRGVDEAVAVTEKHDAAPEAVSLAWLAAKGLCPILKVSSECRPRANPNAVSLELDAADMTAIDSIESEVELFPE